MLKPLFQPFLVSPVLRVMIFWFNLVDSPFLRVLDKKSTPKMICFAVLASDMHTYCYLFIHKMNLSMYIDIFCIYIYICIYIFP